METEAPKARHAKRVTADRAKEAKKRASKADDAQKMAEDAWKKAEDDLVVA